MVSTGLSGQYLHHCHVVTQHQHMLMVSQRAQATAIETSSLAAMFSDAQSAPQGIGARPVAILHRTPKSQRCLMQT